MISLNQFLMVLENNFEKSWFLSCTAPGEGGGRESNHHCSCSSWNQKQVTESVDRNKDIHDTLRLNQWPLKTGPRPARTRKFLSRAELGVSRHCAAVLRCHWNTGNYLTISCWHIERLFKTFPFIQLYGHEHSDGFRLIPGWGVYVCCFAIFTNSGCFGRKV